MVTAIVMIKTETGLVPETAASVAALDGVSEVYSVTGEWDLIAIARVAKHEDLADLIPGRLNKVHGVLLTETHTAFRAYSDVDLDAAFALGLE
jgi:DNA-binding Lrp family transcriptional regulator